MKNFTEEYIIISGIKIMRLIDENGIKWYPLNQFFRKILFKNFNVRYYRDDPSVNKHMQVISYMFNGNTPLKTWFINEYGLKVIISNTTVIQRPDVKSRIRERKLYDACNYFGIKRDYDLKPIIIQSMPDIKDYDIWSKICIESDENATQYNIWKKCEKCDKYYPNTSLYYEKMKAGNGESKLKRTCRKCRGKLFIPTNSKKQYELKNGGIELVTALYNKDYIEAFKIIQEKNMKYAPNEFYSTEASLKLTKYIKKNIIDNNKEYYARNVAKILNMPTQKLYDLIKNQLNIGCYKPFKPAPKKEMTESKLLQICAKRFPNRLSKKQVNIPDIEPVIGFLTKRGLVVICHNPKPMKNAKLYQFTSNKHSMTSILKSIERMSADEG